MIAEKVITYINRTMSASGFTVLDAGTAFRVMPDLWSTRRAAGFDFSVDAGSLAAIAQARGAAIYMADVEGIEEPVRLLAMSDDELERRALRMTGLRLSNLRPWKPEASAPADAPKPIAPAADEPPSWPCRERTRWFQSKGLPDPLEDRGALPGLPTVDEGVFAGRQATKPRH